MSSVLFVCLGNICRSPAAEGLLRHKHAKAGYSWPLEVGSCGLGTWHIGHLPNESMRDAASKRNVILTSRARAFDRSFFEQYDYILAVDPSVLNALYEFADTPEHKSKIHLFTEYSSSYYREAIPDPFALGDGAFEHVLDILEDACDGLLNRLVAQQK